jgi:signal transduction histidine kinase/DNA-binding response OmpR family regulator
MQNCKIEEVLKSYLIFWFFFLQWSLLMGQESFTIKEIGTPYIEEFTPDQYFGHTQIWDITQDEQGLIYIAYTGGVSQFDGKYWKEISNRPSASSLTFAPDGRIYAGQRGMMSVLVEDATSTYVLESLMPKIALEHQKVGVVREIENYKEDVVFRTGEALYIYHTASGSFKALQAKGEFISIACFGDRLIAFDSKLGLLEYINGDLLPMENGDQTIGLGVQEILPLGDDGLLLLTSSNGLFKFNEQGITYWEIELSNFLKGRLANTMKYLKGGYIGIATIGDGLFIINEEGRLIQKLNEKNGLISNIVYNLYQSPTGTLWVAMKGGINLIHVQLPFTFIDEKSGLKGSYNGLELHNDVLYICGDDGVYKKEITQPWQSLQKDDVFEHYDENQYGSTWVFIKKGKDLFCGGGNGLFLVKEQVLEPISDKPVFSVLDLKNPDAFILNGDDKLHLIRRESGKWKYKWEIKNFNQEFDFMLEINNLEFLGTESSDGLFRVQLNKKEDSVILVHQYSPDDGLPTIRSNRLYKHGDEVAITTRKGVYKLGLNRDRVIPNEDYNELDSIVIFRLPQDPKGNIFLSDAFGPYHYLRKLKNGRYKWQSESFLGLKTLTPEFVLPVDTQNVFIAGDKGLAHYNPSMPVRHDQAYVTLVRKVSTTTKNDSLIFGGVSGTSSFILPYSENALSIEFSAAYYERGDELQFQYRLDGFDDNWSVWDKSTEKEYTNLPHGDFQFQVKSRNIYGYEGQMATFNFSILPPWYFTIYAYIGYVALFTLFVWSIVRFNSRRLVREKKALEQVVLERTEEIREQKNNIEKQAKRLLEMDKVKSRFFANISHELRTPITLINGPAEAMLKGNYGKLNGAMTDGLEVIKNNGKNLQVLVNEILDLTKLEAGKLKLIENPSHYYSFIAVLVHAYQQQAMLRKIEYSFDYNCDKGGSLLLDENRYAKVVNNLLSNAFKFTPDGGNIRLKVELINNELQLQVKDSGAGIHPDDIDLIFDRYYQSEQPDTKAIGGSGIGLALAKELAKLLRGNLTVKSELGCGSEFVFSILPKWIESDSIELQSELPDLSLITKGLEETISTYVDLFNISKPRLLVAEDHNEMRAFILQILNPFFDTISAKNGLEALSILGEKHVDMIVSDVMMPKMDGFELLDNIKSEPRFRDIPVIMLTARSAEEDKLHALTLGVDDYLTKPFNLEELLVRTKNILENRVVRHLATTIEKPKLEEVLNVDQEFVKKMHSIIDKNISDSLLSVSYLAHQLNLTERQLLRKVKALTGYTPIQFIQEVRLQKAKRMIESNLVNNVSEACFKVGFEKVKYFSSLYINRFGKRPSDSL